jgi:hypothetical protein
MGGMLRRRTFLQSASALGLGAGLGSLDALLGVSPAHASEMALGPGAVQFRPEIEPVVRWIEDTPRDKVFEVALAKLKAGLSYRDLLSGLFLAGIRNIKPRPVGFKFHAVLVINSAHLLALAAPTDERLLPLFWALDNFKNSQAQDVREGDWTLQNVDESHLPRPHKARADFVKAMDAWDSDAADVAVAALTRSSGAAETMEAFWRYAVRDQRDIGHKAIFAAQCWRTLQTIGWTHAEPVLRSLAYGLLDLQGDKRPVAVGPYEENLANVKKVREDWSVGRPDPGATKSLLETIRHADPVAASAEAVRLLNEGIAPGALWDAVALGGNEFLLKNPGIIAIHAVTASNALHYIFQASGDDSTRKLALLQAVGWLPFYRDRIKPSTLPGLDVMEPASLSSKGDEAVAEVFETVGKDRTLAAQKVLAFLREGGSPAPIFAAARRMIFHKGKDSHEYKYGAAVWEECLLVSDPKWQAPLAAASMAYVPGSSTPDSPLMKRAREAVAHVLG